MSELTEEQKRVKIAEVCGYKRVKPPNCAPMGYQPKDKEWSFIHHLPNYFHDLNACAEMRKALPPEQRKQYYLYLAREALETNFDFDLAWFLIDATPAQHCEAFAASCNPPLW